MSGEYREIRPYRYKKKTNLFFQSLMEKRFKSPFSDYWEQFGYEIGGPVCYAYVRWLIDGINSENDISSIAFVARDGWLLKKVYEMMTVNKSRLIRYIYAPRSVCLLCQGESGKDRYAAYLDQEGFHKGPIAVVDSVTMKFSSQRLISGEGERPTVGFFWLTLSDARGYGKEYTYHAFQKEHFHTIKNWNLVEFILSSPEPPIESFRDGHPVYMEPKADEISREAHFLYMEKGVLAFIEDVIRDGKQPQVSNREITEWINDFLNSPGDEDIAAFKTVTFSERSDHADTILLDPFGLEKKSMIKVYKDRLWFWSQSHPHVYTVLHTGKSMLKHTVRSFQKHTTITFDGHNVKTIMNMAMNADIVSFDIFNTLLVRPYKKPTDLFYDLEKDNGLFDFHDNRIKAEQFARQHLGKLGGEVNLSDICTLLANSYGIQEKQLEEREVEKELEVCYPNPCFLALVNKLEGAHKTMIATSDMYLSSETLRVLLDKNGFSAIGHIFVSNEYGAGKYDGSLQKAVWDTVGREKRILHVGDDYDADVKHSKAVGWEAILYLG